MKKRKTVLAVLLTTAVALMSGCGNQTSEQAAQTAETEAPAQETETPGTDEAQAEDKTADEVTDLWFYYPTQVGGDLATGMEQQFIQVPINRQPRRPCPIWQQETAPV